MCSDLKEPYTMLPQAREGTSIIEGSQLFNGVFYIDLNLNPEVEKG